MKLLASLGAMLVSSIGMAQVDVESNNLFSKVDKLIDGNKKLASKVDTNYIKTPWQPWQISVTSRVSQTARRSR